MLYKTVEERKKEFISLSNEYCNGLISPEFYEFLNTNFFTPPASRKYHAAYEGGLYDHSLNVFKKLDMLTKSCNLKWERPESPFIIGMFHDLCKYDQYSKPKEGSNVYEFNGATLLKGHGSKSVIILSRFINLTEEEMLCIRYHMGAYEKEEWDEFDMAIKKYPNVLWTHMADMLACKVDGL